MKKIKQKISKIFLAGMLLLMSASAAWAEGVSAVDADTISSKLLSLVNSVLMPFGSLVILIAIIISAFKIITTANRPDERARAISSLPYIIGGGLLLGGAMLVAGFVIGQWDALKS